MKALRLFTATGHEMFRGDLALMYLSEVDARTGQLISLRMVPMQMRRFRLNYASQSDAQWLNFLLNELGTSFATWTCLADDNSLNLIW